ncbi:hypothetical protein ACG2LH_16030 [Zhouia sp. PK063]|uniref:hypothetical protein n=1 Tax=Zhouia sp. PK063 TaxID=3373602 RepID=UPI00379BA82D
MKIFTATMAIKTISFIAFFLLFNSAATPTDKKVYICTGKYSKKYHYKKNCRGLNACKSSVKEITLKEALAQHKTLCGWED